MMFNTKRVILWLPALILAVTALVVAILLIANNSKRLSKLEEGANQQTITFTFNQGAARFRIVCKEDPDNPTVYICSTIQVGGPRVTPSPSVTVSPGG